MIRRMTTLSPASRDDGVPRGERRGGFTVEYHDDLQYWLRTNPKLLARIFRLVEETLRDPFRGTGKPEPLKHREPDLWSRRIDGEHRLVYRVTSDRTEFLRARGHYD